MLSESKRIILLTLLFMVRLPQARVKIGKSKIWKPSIAESISGFILHIKISILNILQLLTIIHTYFILKISFLFFRH